MVALAYTLTNATTADADQVQRNFTVLRDAMSSLKNADIASSAAIDKAKLAQTFQVYQETVVVVPPQSGTTLMVSGSTDVFDFGTTAMTEILNKRIKLRSGQQAFLCAVEWHVQRMQNTGGTPRVDITLDGVQVGGQPVGVDTSDAYYLVANANPIDNPLAPLQSDSVIEYRVGCSATGATVTLAGVTCTLTIKVEVVP